MLQIAFSTFHYAFNRNLLAFYQIDLLLSFFPLKALLLRKKEMIFKKKNHYARFKRQETYPLFA